jgi:hypothetical protein
MTEPAFNKIVVNGALIAVPEHPYVSWKGKTFNQVYSSVQMNYASYATEGPISGNTLFLANPVKLHRREIASAKIVSCNPRTSASIDIFNSPNGCLVNPSNANLLTEGLVGTLDMNYENNSTQHPGLCSGFTTQGVCQDPASNARRRVRSAGMIQSRNNTYFTNTNQYLGSRCKTYNQNQYVHLRSGNANVKPGSAGSTNNVYAPNSTLEFCPVVRDFDNNIVSPNCVDKTITYKPNNPLFAQQGGVSSSNRIARLKYDTITNNGYLFSQAYGNQVGNALAYGSESDKYTIKDKIGFPNIKTPVITKYGATSCCTAPGAIESNECAFRPGQ